MGRGVPGQEGRAAPSRAAFAGGLAEIGNGDTLWNKMKKLGMG
jgi:hypothetical protein